MAKYIRNSKAVLSNLSENKAGQILTKVNCKIQVPERFLERGLGEASVNTFAYGCFPIILESGQYGLLNICALVELNPTKTIPVEIDGVGYKEFHFDANTVVIKSTTLVLRDIIMFNVFDEFIFKGNIPWYMEYEDIGKLFDTAKKFAGSTVGDNPEIIEFMASLVARPKEDRSKYLRVAAKSYQDTELSKIDYIALTNVFYAVNSTANKLVGSYFTDGVVSALVNPTKDSQRIETILRA